MSSSDFTMRLSRSPPRMQTPTRRRSIADPQPPIIFRRTTPDRNPEPETARVVQHAEIQPRDFVPYPSPRSPNGSSSSPSTRYEIHRQQQPHPYAQQHQHTIPVPTARVVSPERQQQDANVFFFMARRFVAIDCEMVGVGPAGRHSVLARVSLVDFFGNCLLDTFVRVEERVTDYRTHVSGVNPSDLTSPLAMPFGRCRKLVRDLTRNKVLVGHAINNDLSVLGIEHPWEMTRDTSTYRPYMHVDKLGRCRPKRLRDLARTHLGLIIQQDGIPHDSLDDACAAMALYRKVQSEWDFAVDCRRRAILAQQRQNRAMTTTRYVPRW